MKERIPISVPWLLAIFGLLSCKSAPRSGDVHQPFLLKPTNISSFADLQPSAICEDEMGPVNNQTRIENQTFVVQTERPMLEDGYCKMQIYGKADPELKFLSAKKSGPLPLYYESRHIKMQPEPLSFELWKLVEGKGRAPAKILVTISELNVSPSEARLKCNEFSTTLPKSRSQASLVEFDVDIANLNAGSGALTNCVVSGSAGQTEFTTQSIPTLNLSWGGQAAVSATLRRDSIPKDATRTIGLPQATVRSALPGVWTLRNPDGSCYSLEFRTVDSGLSYRYFRGDGTNCKQPPSDLPFKDLIHLSREDDIPTTLRSKIGVNSFLLQFKRAGEESSWSLMTLTSGRLSKLGNNILKPSDLNSVTQTDVYLKN